MPAYISHAIFGDEIYEKGLNDKLFKSQVDHDSLKTYSIGIDLSEVINNFKFSPHGYKTQDFIFSMIRYIKENNLTQNPVMLSYLYAHIGHFFFDIEAHPLIYYVEKGCKRVGLIPPHFLVEGYVSAYLVQKKLGKDIMDIKRGYWNRAKFNNPEIVKIVKSLYGSVYEDENIIISYKMFKLIFTSVEWACKDIFITKDILIGFFSFNRFLRVNNLSLDEIHNENNGEWLHPVTGQKHYESIIDLYNKALERALYAIQAVNRVLYDGVSFSSLESVFPNLSYDTGLDVSMGNDMKYTRVNNHRIIV